MLEAFRRILLNMRICELVPRTVTHLEEAEQGLRINGAEVCQRAHLGEDCCELDSEPEIVRMLRRQSVRHRVHGV